MRDVLALAGLGLLVLAFFWKVLLTNRVLVGLDLFTYFYPYRDYVAAELRAGHLPLWNPYLFMGAPLLANSQAAVLYPLDWPWLWLSTPKQIAWSIGLHVWLAAAGTYLLARRRLHLGRGAAFVAATIFALGGFLGAQVEHINQLHASAWLPWLLLCLEGGLRWRSVAGGGLVVGLMLLAGHTQATYIVLWGAGLWAIWPLVRGLWRRWRAGEALAWLALLRPLTSLATMVALGVALAAVQILPTLELSRLSVRSGGLPYREAVSFSLKPGLILQAFLPPLLWEPPFSEYVAYVGLVGLGLVALGTWAAWRKGQGARAILLALAGLFLALGAHNPIYFLLYKAVPGFALFRVPARWLLLWAFGAALVAGQGLAQLKTVGRGRHVAWGLTLILVSELFGAGRRLAYNQPTAPAAWDSMRTATAHLLAQPDRTSSRFLSLSGIEYDPGDQADLEAMFAPFLPEQAVYDLVVVSKMKEVLAFNLPLRYRLRSVDGYDGGLLPLRRYVTLERLFLPEDQIWPDGRLRQQLERVPPTRLLGLLNVQYVITDKVEDVWLNDLFYDLEHPVPLGEVRLADLPDFAATGLGLVVAADASGVAEAQVTITDAGGDLIRTGLTGTGAQVWDWGEVRYVTEIAVVGRGTLQGLTLVDRRTGTFRNLVADPAYRLVHSGDVKIYDNQAALRRAFVVHRAEVAPDDETALSMLGDPTFDPARTVLLADGSGGGRDRPPTPATLVRDAAEEIRIECHLDEPGWLLLTDTFYPGWVARVDGAEVPIQRANIYFRAVPLEAGSHQVELTYQPLLFWWGAGISLVTLLGLIGAWAAIGRGDPSSV
jgi:hypothetical protein